MLPIDDRFDDVVAIGVWSGVQVGIVPRDAVSANASVAIAGVFRHEVAGDSPGGGLGHLDAALGGAIIRLRADGIFGAGLGEVLTLSAPAPPIHAGIVLAIGLGDPDVWKPAMMRQAVAVAARETLLLEADTAAFAPSLLDSGLEPERLEGTPEAMLTGLLDALTTHRPATKALSRWMFCVGPSHLEPTKLAFREAFDRLPAP